MRYPTSPPARSSPFADTFTTGDIQPKEGSSFKLIVINNSQKLDERGEAKGFAVGIPFPAYHDMAIGVDLRIDESAARRAAGE